MSRHAITREIEVARPLEEVFTFFSDPKNLESITPQWLRFRIVPPEPDEVREGSLIHYKLRVRGIPVRWTTRISVWDPPHRFVDEQLSGPYRSWVHEHTFRARGGHTVVRDHVRYDSPGGSLIHRWLVRPDVERIFDYRSEALRDLFG